MPSIIGAYALNVNMSCLTIIFVFSVIGYFFTKLKIPAAPIVSGLIPGNMTDSNFRRALQASHGSFAPFVPPYYDYAPTAHFSAAGTVFMRLVS